MLKQIKRLLRKLNHWFKFIDIEVRAFHQGSKAVGEPINLTYAAGSIFFNRAAIEEMIKPFKASKDSRGNNQNLENLIREWKLIHSHRPHKFSSMSDVEWYLSIGGKSEGQRPAKLETSAIYARVSDNQFNTRLTYHLLFPTFREGLTRDALLASKEENNHLYCKLSWFDMQRVKWIDEKFMVQNNFFGFASLFLLGLSPIIGAWINGCNRVPEKSQEFILQPHINVVIDSTYWTQSKTQAKDTFEAVIDTLDIP